MLLFICLGITAVILTLVYFTSRTRFGAARVCGLAVVGLGLSFGCMFSFFLSPVLMLQCLLTFVAGLICLAVRAKPKAIFASSVVAGVASYAFGFWMGYDQLRDLKHLREEYAFESMDSRLTYENAREVSASSVPLDPTVEQRLGDFENRGSYSRRTYMLEVLHERARDKFILTSGFGIGRMSRPRKERIVLPKTESVPLPLPSYVPEYDSTKEQATPLAKEPLAPDLQPVKEELLSMHDRGLQEFLDPERMGYVKDREQVAGFTSHAIQRIPKIDPRETDEQWQVTRLELVSLLKHDRPMVYVSKHLPQMDELEDATTRPLDSFESNALEQLRRSEDLVVESRVNQIRLLGSLRAGKDCLECHSVQRGDLLGAFSYNLFRVRPMPVPKKSKPVKPHA